MKYSHNYPKLQKSTYTTIRRYPKGKVGTGVTEIYPEGWHFAQIARIERKRIVEIPTKLLLEDTNAKTRPQAIALLNSFYKKPIDPNKERLYIYYMRRID